jgi:hypothetical protein
MAAGWRCAAVGGTAKRLRLSAKVPTRYTAGAESCCDRREAEEPLRLIARSIGRIELRFGRDPCRPVRGVAEHR